MKIQFLGASGTVTGSKYLLEMNGARYLVDCGLYQGLKALRERNWQALPIDPQTIHAVVLTHAHIDHSGYLPRLVKMGFSGPIYASEGTRALCEVLLPDAGHLQEEDAEYANKRRFSKHKPALPLYTEEDARDALKQFKAVGWETPTTLGSEVSFELHYGGHILGAAIVEMKIGSSTWLFSGDLGRPQPLTLRPPETSFSPDYLVVESTYGNRQHPDEDARAALQAVISRTLQRGGIALIPAFAVGRSQQILYLIWQLMKAGEIPKVPVYLNSPMAVQATRLFFKYAEDQALSTEECDAIYKMVEFVQSAEESKALTTRDEPAIIISASGMATGGRVLHHLKKLLPEPRNTVIFVGFQAAGTRGESLVHGAGEVKIHGAYVPVRAEICSLDHFSAHADGDEIIAWLSHFPRKPRRTFITHGEPIASEALRRRIQDKLGWACEVPDYQETFEFS